MKQITALIILNVFAVFFTTGCGKTSSTSQKDDHVITISAGDKEMNAAISEAQSTLTNFIATLASPQPNQKYFLVKGKFASGNAVEHIWVADVTFDGKVFRGVIANDPEILSGLSFKQHVEVQPIQVSDWMFIQDGKLVGGYTLRVLRDRMTEQERRDQDAKIPYSFN
jgi:uncharacterized protein YegJ (DUF2314 family)